MTTTDWTSPPTQADGARYIAGWGSAATEIHRVGTIAVPVVMRLSVAEHPPLVIDFARRTVFGELPFDRYPATPGSVQIDAEAVAPGAAAPSDAPAAQLDNMLWSLGLIAFGDGAAPWLREGDRYRLTRWPNFTELAHTMDTIRMTALLGAGYLSVDELASGAAISRGAAQRVVNSLALMGAVSVAAGTVPQQQTLRPDAAVQSRGLFRRLRDRLGL